MNPGSWSEEEEKEIIGRQTRDPLAVVNYTFSRDGLGWIKMMKMRGLLGLRRIGI